MNINPVKSEIPLGVTQSKAKGTDPEQQSEEGVGDSLMTEQNQQLMGALRNEPDVRPEVVARGKSLAADPNYPSDDIVSELAKVFTTN